jgi:hypothetical protein
VVFAEGGGEWSAMQVSGSKQGRSMSAALCALALLGCSSGESDNLQTPMGVGMAPPGAVGPVVGVGVPPSTGAPMVGAVGGSTPVGMAGSNGTPITAGSGQPPSTGVAGTGSSDPMMTGEAGSDADPGMPSVPYHDPGSGPWEKVPEADLMSVCKLDLAKLQAASSAIAGPWLIVRYGKLCYEDGASNFLATEAWSTTKTLGALVAGIVNYQTRDVMRTGKKTGRFSDEDDASQWLDLVPYNANAKVAHVLGMVAHDGDLSWGAKSFAYDTVGTTEINTISTMMSAAMGQVPAIGTTSVAEFTQKNLFDKLGMPKSSWGGTVLAYSWSTDLYDMAKVGVLINNWGMWQNERLVDEQWIYRMTHPSFEDANTGFGYLTWLNSSSNWTSIAGGKNQGAATPGECAPVAIHKSYPHGVSEAMNCNYEAPYTCDQKYDVGVWQAEGLGGQLIQGHRGLDIVIVARDAQPGGTGPGTAMDVWEPLKGAVIAGDPMFKGDEAAFCEAYGHNQYAPDLH